MKISITTPSIRPDFIGIVATCIKKQDFTDFEWLIGTKPELIDEMKAIIGADSRFRVLPEPPKHEKDFYNLNKCWNMLFREAKGELIVNIVDGIWFPNDVLTMFWNHYEKDKKACISAVGNQYDPNILEFGKPMIEVWRDPRMRLDQGSFYQVYYTEMELCLASLPRQAILDVGGLDPLADKYAALFEKEMCARIEKAGYTLWLSQDINYRALNHPRLYGQNLWDEKYKEGWPYFDKCIAAINNGTRLKLDFI